MLAFPLGGSGSSGPIVSGCSGLGVAEPFGWDLTCAKAGGVAGGGSAIPPAKRGVVAVGLALGQIMGPSGAAAGPQATDGLGPCKGSRGFGGKQMLPKTRTPVRGACPGGNAFQNLLKPPQGPQQRTAASTINDALFCRGAAPTRVRQRKEPNGYICNP